ncbi:VWA domain-containing protein [Marinibactrum halimedae]|uniref:VWA domain-containing protein n=1 Tax=Marinibactrum halimedae TaxID=1444977 RepID=UPI001E4EFF69|nr:VWA domain-containing protein [Marinibactrum halimedae]MCD9457875.1 VWA domain-containing protein [Marinibactrum halimedae]
MLSFREVASLSMVLFTVLWMVTFSAMAQSPQKADVRLVIDISGSMKQNDPNNLRRPAVDLLVKLLPEGSKAGVWTFGQSVDQLVSHQVVDEQWAKNASAKARNIHSSGLYTNIGQALETALADASTLDKTFRSNIILLTDGMVDISKEQDDNLVEWRRIVDETIPKLKEAGVVVHTIALSDNADTRLLNRLALSTDGIAAVAKTADELMQVFLQAFDQAAPSEQLPLDGDTFVVDSSVEEFTALIFRSSSTPTELLGPDQTRYSEARSGMDEDVNWYATDRYDLVTLKKPLEGEWSVRADMAPGSRITVISNLNVYVEPMPTNIFRGQTIPLSLRLQEDGKTIDRPEFLELLDVTVTKIAPSEQEWKMTLSDPNNLPNDGVYSTELEGFTELGNHDLIAKVDGKSFFRQFTHTVSVRDAFNIHLRSENNNGEVRYLLSITPNAQTLNFKKTSVVARVKNPTGRSSIKPIPLKPNDVWELEIVPKEEGQYAITLAISVVENNGNRYQYDHPVETFYYPEKNAPKKKSSENTDEDDATQKDEDAKQDIDEDVEEGDESEEESSLLLYILLGVGNVVVLGVAYFAYRVIVGNSKSDESSEDEGEKKESDSDTNSEKEAEPEPAQTESLAMADIGEDEDLSREDDSSDTDSPEKSLTGTDLASDEPITESDIPMDSGSDELPPAPMDDLDAMLAETADEDEEFSLDDFSAGDIAGDDFSDDDFGGDDNTKS